VSSLPPVDSVLTCGRVPLTLQGMIPGVSGRRQPESRHTGIQVDDKIARFLRTAARGPDNRLVRTVAASTLLLLAAALAAVYLFSEGQRAALGPRLWATSAVEAGLAIVLLASALTSLGRAHANSAAGALLTVGSVFAVFATSGAHGILNLAVPMMVFVLAATLPVRTAVFASVVLLSSHLAATVLAATVSGGIATMDAADPDPQSLIERADAALYEAKRAGKNRMHAAGNAVPPITGQA